RGVYELTTEARLKLVGMFTLGKAEDGHVDIVLTIRVAAPAEGEPLCMAENVDRQGFVPQAAVRGECDLMGPVSIHHRFAELAFTMDHRPLQKWSPPALDATCRERGKDTRSRSDGRRWVSIAG